MAVFHRFHFLRDVCGSGLFQSAYSILKASNTGLWTKMRQLSFNPIKIGFSNEILWDRSIHWQRSLPLSCGSTISRYPKNQQTSYYSSNLAQKGGSSEEQLNHVKKEGVEHVLNTRANQSQEEYFTIYRFPYMKQLRVLSRLKLAQTTFTVTIVPPMWYLSSIGYISEDRAFYSVTLATFALMMLYAMSIYLRRIIGFLYLHRDGTHIKIAHLTFWGKRQEQTVPVADVIPIAESGDKPTEILLLLRRYSSTKKLYFTLKYGQITDRERFCEVFGSF